MIKHAVYVLNKRLKNKSGLGCPKIQLLERRFSTLRLKERWQEGNESSGHNINAFAEYDWIVKALPTPDKTEEEKKNTLREPYLFLCSADELFDELSCAYDYVETLQEEVK